MWYLTAGRGYDLLRAWVSASCAIPQLAVSNSRQGVRFATGMGLLPLVISHSRQRVRFVTGMGSSASCGILRQTGDTICYGHGILHLLVSDSRQGVRFGTGMGFCIL